MTSPCPRISIVTPSYNQGQFLEQCIQSVLNQNYPNLEYIIMDGGSTDNSSEIIRKYEKHLAYSQCQKDGGQFAAINEGFKRSTGEIMAWINSDDQFHPDAFATVAEIFSGRPEVEWITGRPNGIDAEGKQTWVTNYSPIWSRAKYLKKQYDPFIQQEGTFWRRSLWEKAGAKMDVTLKLAGDLELWARFFRHAQLFVVDDVLGAFRMHTGQKTEQAMAQYSSEAEMILDLENKLFAEQSDKVLLPAPPSIQTRRTDPALAAEQELNNKLRSWAENVEALLATERNLSMERKAWAERTETSLAEERILWDDQRNRLRRHWWIRLGRRLKFFRWEKILNP
jgi:O-antigen biosynthesis protein